MTKAIRANIISNAQEKKRLKQAIVEMTHVMQRVDGEKEALSDLVKETALKFSLPAKRIKKLATTMYKQNYSDYLTEHENFEVLYESLFKTGESVGPADEEEEEETEEV